MDIGFINSGLQKTVEKLQGWGEGIVQMLPNLLVAVFILVIFNFLSRSVYRLVQRFFARTNLNRNLEQLLASMAKLGVLCVGLVLALAVLELQKTVFSLLAGVGVVGLALGFAFQDLASNFISGIMLAVRTPVRIGDVIEINGTLGTVKEILLRETVILNFSGQEVFVPNKEFTGNSFTNYSSNGQRKVEVSVGVGYEDDIEEAVEAVREALKSVPNILKDPGPEAWVEEFGGSSVNISGFVWFKYPGGNFLEIRHDAHVRVKKALDAKGFNIPFPIRTFDIPDGVFDRLSTSFQASSSRKENSSKEGARDSHL